MTFRALTLGDVAAELGRSPDWLQRHYGDEVRLRGMPAPIHERGGLVWSAPALWAWIDRDLREDLRPHAAAYRAALLAAREQPDVDDIAAARARLDARFGRDAA